MAEFTSSWLVQRLEKPLSLGGGLKDNPFSFGGGYKNGGLTDDAMGLLRDIFSFDYMGAAEFEFGAVPEALNKIAKAADKGKLSAFSFDLSGHTIYALAPTEWEFEVEVRIREFAKDYGPSYYRLKETTALHDKLFGEPQRWRERLSGWLELDNGFFFFTDEEMWQKTCELFGTPS